MKIKGFYILTRRSVIRILAILGIAVGSLYAETTAESKVFSSRVEDVQAELISLKKRLPEDSSRAQLPDVQYLEYKSVYLEAKRYNKEHENPAKTARRWGEPSGRAVAARRDASPHHAAVTKADLRAAAGFTADDRKMLRNMNDMLRRLIKTDCEGKNDRRPAEERNWIGKAVRLYILWHDIEAKPEATFSAVCRRYWSHAQAYFKDAKQYKNKVAYDYKNFYDIDAEKRKIGCRIVSVP